MQHRIILCDRSYASQILDILNEAIVNSTALYDYHPRPAESMVAWFDDKEKNNYPVFGLVDEQDRLLAFSTYGPFRTRPAYQYTIEHSVYVHSDHRGKGYGKQVLTKLIEHAKSRGYHCIMAGIDASNAGSIKFHMDLGFSFCGRMKEVGFKFGRWLDLDFYQLLLETPENPTSN